MKTTKTQFNLFVRECKRLIKDWGLSDWEVYFRHGCDDSGCYAQTYRQYTHHIATIAFCDDWPGEVNPICDEQIINTARHEVLHVLLSDMAECMNMPYKSELQCVKAEETAINRLQKIIR